MKYDEVARIIKEHTKANPRNSDLARIINISKQAMLMRSRNNAKFSDADLELLSKAYDIDFNADGSVLIDRIHINPSCGKGTTVYADAITTPIKLGKELIKSVLKISNPNTLKIFKASGDSMQPTINNNDLLIVDTACVDYINGGIFLLTINNDWYIKRLRQRVTGELDIISDNNKYPIETFAPDADIEIIIKGRVIMDLSKGL